MSYEHELLVKSRPTNWVIGNFISIGTLKFAKSRIHQFEYLAESDCKCAFNQYMFFFYRELIKIAIWFILLSHDQHWTKSNRIEWIARKVFVYQNSIWFNCCACFCSSLSERWSWRYDSHNFCHGNSWILILANRFLQVHRKWSRNIMFAATRSSPN